MANYIKVDVRQYTITKTILKIKKKKNFKTPNAIRGNSKKIFVTYCYHIKSVKEKQLMQQQCKENKSDNFCYCKVWRSITKLGAIVNRPILILEY